MGRKAGIWWRASKHAWYVKIGNKQARLSRDKKEAEKLFYKIKAGEYDGKPLPGVPHTWLACEICDKFITWCYSAREKLVGRAELSENNFRGRAEGVNLLWETGGFKGRNSFHVGYYKPWLDSNRTSLSIDLYNKLVYRFSEDLGSTTSGDSGR